MTFLPNSISLREVSRSALQTVRRQLTAAGQCHVRNGFGGRVRKRLFLILSARIFDSRVERGIPSRAAAPECPNTRPPLSRKASSIIAFSCAASEPYHPTWLLIPGPADSQLSSTVNSSV